MTREEVKAIALVMQACHVYPSRKKIQKTLMAWYGHGVSTLRLIPMLQQIRGELGISCRPNRQEARRSAIDSIPAQAHEAPPMATSAIQDPTPGAARCNGEPMLLRSHPERCAPCGESDWGRFGQAERGWPPFDSTWRQCMSCRTVHPPSMTAGEPPLRVPPSRCERCRDIRFFPMAAGRWQCFGCGIHYAPLVLARETPWS